MTEFNNRPSDFWEKHGIKPDTKVRRNKETGKWEFVEPLPDDAEKYPSNLNRFSVNEDPPVANELTAKDERSEQGKKPERTKKHKIGNAALVGALLAGSFAAADNVVSFAKTGEGRNVQELITDVIEIPGQLYNE